MVPKLLMNSRSDNTVKNYSCYFDKWLKWCTPFPEINPLPTLEQYLIIYLVFLLQSGNTLSVIEASLSALKYYHSIVGVRIGDSPICKNILEAIKRIIPKTSCKKKALTVEQLQKAVELLNKKGSLKDMRTKNIMLLSFVGFLRYSECQNLRRSDFRIYEHYAMVFIEKSKTDKYREGHWMYISKLNSKLCPIRNLQEYFSCANIDSLSSEFIFRAVVSTST